MNWTWIYTAFSFSTIVILGTLLSNKSRKWATFFTFIFPFFITTPIVLIFDVFKDLPHPWFAVLKLYTVTFSAICVWFIFKYPNHNLAKILRTLAFGINIMEAVVTEALAGYWLNPLAGFLCLLTLPQWNSLHLDSNVNRVKWHSTFLWVLAYSVWNVCFSLNLYPHLWYLNTFHVVVAHAIVVRDPFWYAEIRAVSLNINFCLMIAFWPAMQAIIELDQAAGPFSSVAAHHSFIFWFSVISAVLCALTIFEQLYKKEGRVWNLLEKLQGRSGKSS